MRTLTALASVLVVSASAAAQTPVVELRLIERFGDTTFGAPGDNLAPTTSPGSAGNANDRTQWMVVLARLANTGGSNARGIAGFTGSVRLASLSQGSYKTLPGEGGVARNASPTAFVPSQSGPAFLQPGGARAIFAPFRSAAAVSDGALGDVSVTDITGIVGSVGPAEIAQLASGAAGEAQFGLGNWIPLYTFQYDFNQSLQLIATFSTDFQASAFTGWDAANNPVTMPVTVVQDDYSFAIPTPGSSAALALASLVACRRVRPRR